MTTHVAAHHALDSRDITHALDILSLVTRTLAHAIVVDDDTSPELSQTAWWCLNAIDDMREGLEFDPIAREERSR